MREKWKAICKCSCIASFVLYQPLLSLFSLVQQKWVTMTTKENTLTLTAIVHTLNTRCILLLGQPNDACYARSLIDLFLALSTTNNKPYWENVLSTSRAWDKPRPTMHRTRYSEELFSCDHVLSSLECWSSLPPPGSHLSLHVGWKKPRWVTKSGLLPLQASTSYSSFHISAKNSCVRPYQFHLCNDKSLELFLCLSCVPAFIGQLHSYLQYY